MRILKSQSLLTLAYLFFVLNRPIPNPHAFLTDKLYSSVDPFILEVIFGEAGRVIVNFTLKSDFIYNIISLISEIKIPLNSLGKSFISLAPYHMSSYNYYPCPETIHGWSGICTELFWNKLNSQSQFTNFCHPTSTLFYDALRMNAPSLSILGSSILYATSVNLYNNITVYMANPRAYNPTYTLQGLFEMRRTIEQGLRDLPSRWNPVRTNEAYLASRGINIIVYPAGNYDIIVNSRHIVRYTRPTQPIQNVIPPNGAAHFNVALTPGQVNLDHAAVIENYERSVESAIASIRVLARQLARARHIAVTLYDNNVIDQAAFDQFNDWLLNINPQVLNFINANTGNYITSQDYISMQMEALEIFVRDFDVNRINN